jgi:o-succinylbenzoate---CoA ligase
MPALVPGDVVAVRQDLGPGWRGLLESVWEAGAALFPMHPRLARREAGVLLALARPTVVVDVAGAARVTTGAPVEGDVAFLVATSGTAGAPRLVELARPAVTAAVAASAAALDGDPRGKWLCCLPLGHVGGLLVVLRSVVLGAPVEIQARFDPRRITGAENVRWMSLVPTMLARLLDAGADLARYSAILVGGGPLPDELRRRSAGVGARVVETYGLTESSGGVVYDGRALPGVRVRTGEDEAIEIAGRTLMTGYRSDPAATAAAFTADGWLRTRDAGAVDGEGRLRVLGRLDDVIVSGGEKIWPQEVEEALRSHPKVADVAVTGRPDPRWGSRVVAFVVPTEPASPPGLEELRDFAGLRIARFRAPRELVVVARLPRTPTGKVRRSALAP